MEAGYNLLWVDLRPAFRLGPEQGFGMVSPNRIADGFGPTPFPGEYRTGGFNRTLGRHPDWTVRNPSPQPHNEEGR
jgi:hypothetical protein